jgi:TolB-like protein
MSLFAELKRRNVVKVGVGYVVIAWLMIQVGTSVLPIYGTPEWFLRAFVLVLLLGFPVALVMAWLLEVTPEGVKVDSSKTGNKWIFAIAAVLAALAIGWYFRGSMTGTQSAAPAASGPPSVAVLPFENLSGDPTQDYFSDGMTEELLNALAKIPGLEVAARTSVFQYKGKGGDVREIGKKLGVQYLIEGSVRRDGQEIRITAQMIRTADGFHLWSENWDRKLEGVFALQDDIAKRIAEQLRGSLGGSALPKPRGDIDPVAYDEYLNARGLLRQRSDLLGARIHAENAVAKAPDFAEGWATVALIYDVGDWTMSPRQRMLVPFPQRMARMAEAAERARGLAPDSALTLHALADVARDNGRFLEAEALYQKAIAADPSYSDAYEDYAEFLEDVGRFDDAIATAKAGIAVDRALPILWFRLIETSAYQGRRDAYDDYLAKFAQVAPDRVDTPAYFADFDLYQGDTAKSRALVEAGLAKGHSGFGEILANMKWAMHDPSIDDAAMKNELAQAYEPMWAGLRGDDELMFAQLTLPVVMGKPSIYQWLLPPQLQHYLADPRAKQLLRDYGFEAYWRVKGWPALCHPLGDNDFECGEAKAP